MPPFLGHISVYSGRGCPISLLRRLRREPSVEHATQHASEPSGAPGLRNELLFSAPQLRRTPLGSSRCLRTSVLVTNYFAGLSQQIAATFSVRALLHRTYQQWPNSLTVSQRTPRSSDHLPRVPRDPRCTCLSNH